MLFSNALIPLIAAAVAINASPMVTRADDSFVSQLANKLKQNGQTTFGGILQDELNKDGSADLVNVLKTQSVTLLVPENEAFDSSNPSIGDNPLNILAYSVIFGDIDTGFKRPNSSFSRRDPNENHIQGTSNYESPKRPEKKRWASSNRNQVVYFNQFVSGQRKRWDPVIYVDRPVDSAKVVQRFKFKNVFVLVVNRLLTLPTTVSDVLCKALIPSTPNGFVKFGGGLQRVGLLDTVDNARGITIFAPVDSAFDSVGDVSDDELASILKNHFYFGNPIGYSALFPTLSPATAESGKALEFAFEDGVSTVRCGNSKAQILRSDVTTDNGILHVIDKVLKCD
ncbi:Fasciclin domain-containing protein [Ceratobasidium sp. AG-Ba]|nr:Fasciclin domain-containing protein [Ceratobasidium sp. AG-Ba]QRW10517.1 Fasciclin domain-containing protein [Ceratobasidium sp. AG-Ba]